MDKMKKNTLDSWSASPARWLLADCIQTGFSIERREPNPRETYRTKHGTLGPHLRGIQQVEEENLAPQISGHMLVARIAVSHPRNANGSAFCITSLVSQAAIAWCMWVAYLAQWD